MSINKLMCAALITSIAISTSACNPFKKENQLLKDDLRDVSDLIVEASRQAEKAMKVEERKYGYYYGKCMRYEIEDKVCNKFYNAMHKYVKKTRRHESVRLSDIKDYKLYVRIHDRYDTILYNTL